LKVLHLIDSLAGGGAEKLLVDSLNELAATRPDDRHYLATLYEDGPLLAGFRLAATRHLGLRLRPLTAPATLRRLRRFIRDEGIEIVHTHLYQATLAGRLAIPRGVALVSTYHTGFHNPASIEYSGKRLLADRLTYRSRHHLVFVSQSVRDEIALGLPPGPNWRVIRNFVSREFRPLYRLREGSGLRLVAVGNLRDQKNHALALEALARCRTLPISLDIYGRGPLQASLEDDIRRTGVAARIITDQRVTSELLAAYDAFLMTSRHEGMSLAQLEAMQTGLPSILNDIPSLRETGADAALYFARDSAASLAEILERCCRDRGSLHALSARAVERASEHGLERYTAALTELYVRVGATTRA
jgi:glycosyltransferase involved in cell wall biosynthesis